MLYIYILNLQQGKYYVGKTKNAGFRLDSHFNSEGSAWTKKYKPIKVEKLISNCDDYDEDKYTRIYMDKYGVDNVRGGSFVQVKLNDNTKEALNKMSNGTKDLCFKCGKKGHFARNCNKYDCEYESEDDCDEYWCCEYCGKEFETKKGCLFHENVYCKKNYKKNKKYKKKNYSSTTDCDSDNSYNFSDDEF